MEVPTLCPQGSVVVRPEGDSGCEGAGLGAWHLVLRAAQLGPSDCPALGTLTDSRRPVAGLLGGAGAVTATQPALGVCRWQPQDTKQMCVSPVIFSSTLWCLRTFPFRSSFENGVCGCSLIIVSFFQYSYRRFVFFL